MAFNNLTSLPDGVFSDLTALTSLRLSGNALGPLDAGLFTGLTALATLELSSSNLSSLPDGVFSGLTALTELYLDDNTLSSLPEELFLGLTSLRTLHLDGNTNTLPLTVTVEKVGTNQVRAKVLEGAPFEVNIPVTVVDGTLAGSATELSVAAGAVDGEALTLTRTAGTTAAVTVDVDLSTPPANHRGYEFVKATANLPATILPADTPPTCTLNPGDLWVRDADGRDRDLGGTYVLRLCRRSWLGLTLPSYFHVQRQHNLR